VRELISASADLVAARRRAVALVVIALVVPAELLERVPSTVGLSVSFVGTVLSELAATLLVAVFLTSLRGLGPTNVGAGTVVGATVRAFIAFAIAELPILPIGLFVVETMRSQTTLLRDVAFDAVLTPWFVVIAPALLATPVCLSERGGPLWSLKRAWSLSSTRRGQVRLLLTSLWLSSAALVFLGHLPGPLSLAPLIATPIIAVAQAALLAALYVRLVAEGAPALTAVTVRSRQEAAAGTFGTADHRNAGRRRGHR
jgi:hypothetical protein